ncbi:MAG: AGE family epimerase/isomerase, partial [Oscillospiraceae bacterium]
DMLQYHVHPEMKCVLETVSDNGGFIDNPSGRTVNPGHACENSWFLMNQAIATDDKELFGKACEILDWSLEIGWDKEYGGLFYYCDAKGRPCEQLEWDMKLWWVHNEALIATLFAYSVTRDLKYWNWFEKINAYAFSHFSDKTHGEWYGYLHRDGTVSHTQKGSMWKGPFHLPRCLMICDYLLQTIAQNETPQSVL